MNEVSLVKLKDLFPLKVRITEEDIKSANVYMIFQCIGAKVLKRVIKEKANADNIVCWGSYHGFIKGSSGSSLTITTADSINMMHITEPTDVVLIIQND